MAVIVTGFAIGMATVSVRSAGMGDGRNRRPKKQDGEQGGSCGHEGHLRRAYSEQKYGAYPPLGDVIWS
jgi:hypothetical protein